MTLAYASYKDFKLYQMDVKSSFLNYIGIGFSSGMTLGGGDLKADLVTTWSDSGSCGCHPEDPM